MAASEEGGARAVGPYLLQRTLGKGQTGENLAAEIAFNFIGNSIAIEFGVKLPSCGAVAEEGKEKTRGKRGREGVLCDTGEEGVGVRVSLWLNYRPSSQTAGEENVFGWY